MSHFLDFRIRIPHLAILALFLLTGLLPGCGETALVPVIKPDNALLKNHELIALEPSENATKVKRNAKIVLSFNVPLDSLTLTVNAEDTQCSGTIQITSNNFLNCVRMNPLELKDNNKKIILTPKGIYATQKFHQIRLTAEIKNLNGVSLKKEITTNPGFKTTWSQQIGTPGDDSGMAVSVDPKGNIYLAGLTSANESGDKKDLFLAKYAPSGFLNWIQQAGFERPVTAAVLHQKKAGLINLRAYSQEKESSAVILAVYAVDGKKIFSKTIKLNGTAPGNGLTMDKDGHIYIPAATPFNVMKISKTGKIILGTELSPGLRIRALAADTENALYITGSIKQSLDRKKIKGGSDIFLLKISQHGLKRWSRTFGTALNESGTALAIHSDQAVAVAGYIPQAESAAEGDAGAQDAFVVKYNSAGKQQWTYIFKGKNSEQSTVVLWTPEGELLVGGYTESSLKEQHHAGKEDAFLAKFDSAGKLLWLRQFGTEENERPLGLALGREGQIFVTGFTEGQMDGAKFSGGRDIFLVQFDKDGVKQ